MCDTFFDFSSVSHNRPGSMVRVVGNIRDYEGAKHVLVFEIFPLEDFNQLTNHLLDVILTHCQHTKGPITVSTCVFVCMRL